MKKKYCSPEFEAFCVINTCVLKVSETYDGFNLSEDTFEREW